MYIFIIMYLYVVTYKIYIYTKHRFIPIYFIYYIDMYIVHIYFHRVWLCSTSPLPHCPRKK